MFFPENRQMYTYIYIYVMAPAVAAGKNHGSKNIEHFKQRENTLKTLSEEPVDRRHEVDHAGLGCKPGLTAWRVWNGCLAGLGWGGSPKGSENKKNKIYENS
jgi:hypothetical protein